MAQDGIVNALLVRYPAGYIERTDAGSIATYDRHEGFLSLDVETYDEAVRIADLVLGRTADPQVATQIGIEPDAADEPYAAFLVGDLITAPDIDGTPASVRVVAVTVSEDTEGNPQFVPEVGVLLLDPTVEQARTLRRLSGGVLGSIVQSAAPVVTVTGGTRGGTISGSGYIGGGGYSGGGTSGGGFIGGSGFPGGTGPITDSPNPPSPVTIVKPADLQEVIFSQAGTLTESESPPYATDRTKRIRAVKALLGTSGGGSVYSVKVNGVSAYSGSLFSGVDSGVPASDTTVSNTDLITVEVLTAAGGDADLTVIVYLDQGSA